MTEHEKAKEECCPHCGKEMIMADLPYCQACGIADSCCPTCRELLPLKKRVCAQCAADIDEEMAK
jgi:hypothetical protein